MHPSKQIGMSKRGEVSGALSEQALGSGHQEPICGVIFAKKRAKKKKELFNSSRTNVFERHIPYSCFLYPHPVIEGHLTYASSLNE